MFGPDDTSMKLKKFTISNAMALSVNLGTWEATLDQYIDSMEAVTEVIWGKIFINVVDSFFKTLKSLSGFKVWQNHKNETGGRFKKIWSVICS